MIRCAFLVVPSSKGSSIVTDLYRAEEVRLAEDDIAARVDHDALDHAGKDSSVRHKVAREERHPPCEVVRHSRA